MDPSANRFYSDIGVDILWTGDLSVTEDMGRPSFLDEDGVLNETPSGSLPSRRGFERYDLTRSYVRATVQQPNDHNASGRVTNASVTGMWVETDKPLPFRTQVLVDWCVMNNFSMRFEGRVVRTTETGMAVVIDVDDSSWRFRSSFIDLARTPSESPPTVVVQPHTGKTNPRQPKNDAMLDSLATQWAAMNDDLSDDRAHQAFITACLKAHRLEYALERYRELKVLQPEAERVNRYLQQIGTILTFSTMQRSEAAEDTKRWKKGVLLLAILVVVGTGALSIAQRLTAQQLNRPAEQVQVLPPGARR
ncbi:MAG: hypothetical protein KC933_13520 [Myxococcales bacterium]|nr:hypothetical protein [Myxococcales bacterium]